MKTVYYKKVGRKYQPISEYDSDLLDSLPYGIHLIDCRPEGRSRRYNIDPNYAAMIAAGTVAEDAICHTIVELSKVQPPRKALTPQEQDAWENLIAVWGDQAVSLTRHCAFDISRAAVTAMQHEADKLMKNQSVRKAYEHFQLMCKLSKEESNDTV